MQFVKKASVAGPKYKSVTPITIAIPKAQQELIKKVPRDSFKAFLDNKQTTTDWYNLCFRIRIGYDIAVLVYTEEASQALKTALDALLSIKDTYLASGLLEMSVDRSEVIEDALDYTDQMCDENTRRIQLDAFHESYRYMGKLVKSMKNKV